MPAATHGWLTAGTESPLNYRGCFCRHRCSWHKSQALTRASTLQQAERGVELISQSITHSPPPRLTALTAKQNDFWSCWMLSAFTICLLMAAGERFIFSHGGICGWAHVIIAALLAAVFPWSSSCLSWTWILCHTVSVTCWRFPTRCCQWWCWYLKDLQDSLGVGCIVNGDRIGKTKGWKCTGVFSHVRSSIICSI